MTSLELNWHGCAAGAVALVILPWHSGVTIAKRNRDGAMYGCRDVTMGGHFDSIVAAWVADAAADGLAIEDRR